MYFDIRTDLACEMLEKKQTKQTGAGVRTEEHNGGKITRLHLKNEDVAKECGKPCGKYLTIDCGRLHLLPRRSQMATERLLARELRAMSMQATGKTIDDSFCVLVAGLGNASLTADAIGPATVAQLTATRHLREEEVGVYRSLKCSALAAFSPGVLGQTGIETQEIIKGVVRAVQPDLLIAVDALAARSCARLSSTVQLCDTGISPGSGVGNHRSELSKKTLGVPVIAMGVPTVVHSATLVYDALFEAGIEEIDHRLKSILEDQNGFFVSPKESDLITESFARLLSNAIGEVFTGGIVD